MTCHESTLQGWIWTCGVMDGVSVKIETLFIADLNPENPTMDDEANMENTS